MTEEALRQTIEEHIVLEITKLQNLEWEAIRIPKKVIRIEWVL